MVSLAPSEQQLTSNAALNVWIGEAARLTQPDDIVCCDGSDDERDRLTCGGEDWHTGGVDAL